MTDNFSVPSSFISEDLGLVKDAPAVLINPGRIGGDYNVYCRWLARTLGSGVTSPGFRGSPVAVCCRTPGSSCCALNPTAIHLHVAGPHHRCRLLFPTLRTRLRTKGTAHNKEAGAFSYTTLYYSPPMLSYGSQTSTRLVDIQGVSLSTRCSHVTPSCSSSRFPLRQMDFLCHGDALW